MKKLLTTTRRLNEYVAALGQDLLKIVMSRREISATKGVFSRALAFAGISNTGITHFPVMAAAVLGFSGILAINQDKLGVSVQTIEANPVSDRSSFFAEALDPILRPQLSPLEEVLLHPQRMEPLPLELIDSETLWLARAIFSETKRVEEQVLVAWVIRNRVETRYRGKRSYEGVVRDPHQFSAFNLDSPVRPFYAGLNAASKLKGWDTALSIAHTVRHLDADYRPFPLLTRHFYSERSLTAPYPPAWARNLHPLPLETGVVNIDQRRFRFFSNVS